MKNNNYYKYLDGLRFYVVFMVIITHYVPTVLLKYQFSSLWVDLLFVLSGFLITEILLKQKKEFNTNSNYSSKKVYASFYSKRALRILPIYLLTIFFFLFIKAEVISQNFSYFLFFLANELVIKQNNWLGIFSHFWSLAVEVQFYVFWPLVIIAFPYKHLNKVILSFLFISLLYYAFSTRRFHELDIFACLSTLCTGAFLAYLKVSKSNMFTNQKYDSIFLFFLTIILFFFGFKVLEHPFLMHLFIILFSFYLMKVLVTKTNPFLNFVMANSVVAFLGKISYGLYLYHNLIPWLLRNMNGTETELVFFSRPLFGSFSNVWYTLLVQFILLLVVTLISWFFIEKPITGYKVNSIIKRILTQPKKYK